MRFQQVPRSLDRKVSPTQTSTAEVLPFPPAAVDGTRLLERALTLARLGMSVFPCRAQEEIDPKTGEVLKAKTPLTPHGFKDASTNPGLIVSWWTRWPNALVGLPTGRENGIAVVDLDTKNGSDWRLSLPRTALELPDTHTVTTRSGGEHRFYRYPDNVEKIASGQNLFKHLVGSDKTGIDVRGDGGYVIAWGDLTRENIADLAEWPTEVFADASIRDREAGRKRTQQPPAVQQQSRQSQPDDFERANAALDFIPADDRDDWVKVGMALKAAFGESGRHAWDAWSATSEKYDAHDQENKWRSFNGTGIGLGTLFELAKQHGYMPLKTTKAVALKGSTALPSEVEVSIEGMLSDGTLKKMFVARHKDDLRHVASQSKWYRYDGKRWIPDDRKGHLDAAWRLCRDVAQQCLSSGQDRARKARKDNRLRQDR